MATIGDERICVHGKPEIMCPICRLSLRIEGVTVNVPQGEYLYGDPWASPHPPKRDDDDREPRC